MAFEVGERGFGHQSPVSTQFKEAIKATPPGRTYNFAVQGELCNKCLANRAVPHMSDSQVCKPKHTIHSNKP